ncbi:MAG: hypothetical protein ACE1ZA_10730, partial [Pseudomonadales bacterium]
SVGSKIGGARPRWRPRFVFNEEKEGQSKDMTPEAVGCSLVVNFRFWLPIQPVDATRELILVYWGLEPTCEAKP